MQEVGARRGRPRHSVAYRGAQTEVAQAIIAMGRIGANLPRMRAQRSRKFKFADRCFRKSLPARVNDSGLADILELVADARGIKKLAEGKRAILPDTGARAIQNLIESGCLPRRALSPIAIDNGHARAMKPFAPVVKQLMRVKLGAPPPLKLRRRVRELVELHRAALLDFRSFESEDRSLFRQASAQLRAACLALPAAELSSGTVEDGGSYLAVATAAMAVQKVLEQLVVSHWHVRTPRYIGRDVVRQILPPFGPGGVPALAEVVSWIQERMAGPASLDFQTALHSLREIVRVRWGEDPFSLAPVALEVSSGSDTHLLECPEQLGDQSTQPSRDEESDSPSQAQRYCDGDENLIASDPWLGPLYGRVGGAARTAPSGERSDDDRFVRRVLRTVDEGRLGAIILFQVVENWYFDDDRGDSIETDFVDRLRAVRVWASRMAGLTGVEHVERVPHANGRPVRRGETASPPSWGDVKVLLRDLARIEVRPWIEMNVDVPDSLPLDEQWWRVDAQTAAAKSCPAVVPGEAFEQFPTA
jgi:hypothetical protein